MIFLCLEYTRHSETVNSQCKCSYFERVVLVLCRIWFNQVKVVRLSTALVKGKHNFTHKISLNHCQQSHTAVVFRKVHSSAGDDLLSLSRRIQRLYSREPSVWSPVSSDQLNDRVSDHADVRDNMLRKQPCLPSPMALYSAAVFTM